VVAFVEVVNEEVDELADGVVVLDPVDGVVVTALLISWTQDAKTIRPIALQRNGNTILKIWEISFI